MCDRLLSDALRNFVHAYTPLMRIFSIDPILVHLRLLGDGCFCMESGLMVRKIFFYLCVCVWLLTHVTVEIERKDLVRQPTMSYWDFFDSSNQTPLSSDVYQIHAQSTLPLTSHVHLHAYNHNCYYFGRRFTHTIDEDTQKSHFPLFYFDFSSSNGAF